MLDSTAMPGTEPRQVKTNASPPRITTVADQMTALLTMCEQVEHVVKNLKVSADEAADSILRRVQAIKREIGG